LSGLCARINMLPCPTAMDRYVASAYLWTESFCYWSNFIWRVCLCLFVCLFVSYIAVRMEWNIWQMKKIHEHLPL
jgi:hypothetical protein